MVRHKNIAAGDLDGIVRAQSSGKHDPPRKSSGGSSGNSGKGLVTTLLDAAAHLGR